MLSISHMKSISLFSVLLMIILGTLTSTSQASTQTDQETEVPPPPKDDNVIGRIVTSPTTQEVIEQLSPPPLSNQEVQDIINLPHSLSDRSTSGTNSGEYNCSSTTWTYHVLGVSALGPSYYLGYRNCYSSEYVPVYRYHFHFYPRPGWNHLHSFIPPSCDNSEPDFSSTPYNYTNFVNSVYTQSTENGINWYRTSRLYLTTYSCAVK